VKRFHEALDPGWGQYFDIEREIVETRSPYQHIRIFETRSFGRVLSLDDVVQTTERDAHIYHEMLAHVPLLSHAAPQRVLIVGGGDGGCLREVLRHPVELAIMVEIDEAVVTACRKHMPGISAGAFEDPRARLEIADGARWLFESDERFDAILIDSSDPVGPNEPLFNGDFYRACATHLAPDGLIAAQHGVAFTQPDAFRRGFEAMASAIEFAAPYRIAVPSYSGGPLCITMGARAKEQIMTPGETLAARAAERALTFRHYTPNLHRAAFALPRDIDDLIREFAK